MKTLYNFLWILAIFVSACQENGDPVDILQKSSAHCLSIQKGYYEMDKYMKYMSGADTIKVSYKAYYEKLPSDTIYHARFHYGQYTRDTNRYNVLYTGDEFITYSLQDSNGRIMQKSLWADEIVDYRHNYKFYDPLFREDAYPLPDQEDWEKEGISLMYLGEEKIRHMDCHHIQLNFVPENDSTEIMQSLREEFHFWIGKKDLIPWQYSIAYDLSMHGDTMFQYERIELTSLDLAAAKTDSMLKLSSVPPYIRLKDHQPFKEPDPLPSDTLAPAWQLVSLEGDTLSLIGLRGKLVLIDFFYKSCYPCMLALPVLQELHEQYADQGLRIVGLDPYDGPEDDLANFLSKRGVTYPVLLGASETARTYRISGYPTVYLISKDGRIIANHVGYGDGTKEELEALIKSNL